MNYASIAATQNNGILSYSPMPFYSDRENQKPFARKLDLNLHCIKRPTQTCFIQITNPNLLAWGIESGDLLVVEKNNSLSIGDLVVMEQDQQFNIYEFIAHSNDEFMFMALDSKQQTIKTANWTNLPIIGTITSTVHQIKPRNTMKFAA